jgi:hypothetical protein
VKNNYDIPQRPTMQLFQKKTTNASMKTKAQRKHQQTTLIQQNP